MTPAVVRIADDDDVVIATRDVAKGERVIVDGNSLVARQAVPAGHKIATRDIAAGGGVRKFGVTIGAASERIARGDWVHSHNLSTRLSRSTAFSFGGIQVMQAASRAAVPTFKGYRRPNGRAGTRNEIWVLNTVACVNHAAERIARMAGVKFAGRVDGIHHFAHPYGCSQLGDDLKNTRRVLAGLLRHPNAGGVLVLGLGCENNQLDGLMALAGDVDRSRVKFFNAQDVIDELEQGTAAVTELVERVSADRRVDTPVTDLVLGHKCGGSDGFSGITANPLLGRIADRLTGYDGTVLLTEVPEMFGAEQVLLDRAASKQVFDQTVAMIDEFKQYFIDHNQPIYENPSPGNNAGGLTTLEEKSMGAVQKGGRSAPVRGVLRYGDLVASHGLQLLQAPGNDGVSSTAMVASGATVLLFTTGRGTPLGFPVPTIKVSSNSEIATKKPHWIDFDAGRALTGEATLAQLEEELWSLIIAVASGERLANNEAQGYREIAIWKEGVTL